MLTFQWGITLSLIVKKSVTKFGFTCLQWSYYCTIKNVEYGFQPACLVVGCICDNLYIWLIDEGLIEMLISGRMHLA